MLSHHSSSQRLVLTNIKSAARGRWVEILVAVTGIPRESLTTQHKPCPKCGGTDRFRAFEDVDETGGVICNQCFDRKNGDGLATIQWFVGCDLRGSLQAVADYLGPAANEPISAKSSGGGAAGSTALASDIVAEVAQIKRMPLESYKAFGAHPAKRGKLTVARVPMFDEQRAECGHFDIGTISPEALKGWNAKRPKLPGLFIATWPEPATTTDSSPCIITEGVKDAAALHGLGFLAIGLPGSELAAKFARVFSGCHVIIVPDRDTPGEEAARYSAARLASIAASVRIATLPSELKESHGDGVREILAKKNGEQLLRQAIADAATWIPGEHPDYESPPQANESPSDPHRLARLYVDQRCRVNDSPSDPQTLRFWRDEWWRWDASAACYLRLSITEIRADLSATIKREFDRIAIEMLKEFNAADAGSNPNKKEKPPVAIQVTTSLVTNVLAALSSLCLTASVVDQPSWLTSPDFVPPFSAKEVIATQSKLIHLPSLVADSECALDPTPEFFSSSSVAYEFDAAADCPAWCEFLESVWPDDPDTIIALQEWFGYLLLPDNSRNKMLLIIGPPRSGKGTIAGIIKAIVGDQNVASPTLRSFSENFGLWPLVGKSVAIVPDARLGGVQDPISIVEKMLSVSGGDPMDIRRMHLPPLLSVRLPTRFVIFSNEMPSLRDSSGALASRLVLLRMQRSFLGSEDRTLFSRLLTELPGILNWAIEGWERLQSQKDFTQPETGEDVLNEFGELSSPISNFVEEFCDIESDAESTKDELFLAWKRFCKAHNRDHEGTLDTFCKDLRACVHTIKDIRKREKEKRWRVYRGIKIKFEVATEQGPTWSSRESALFN